MSETIVNPVAKAMERARRERAGQLPDHISADVYDSNVKRASVSAALKVESFHTCPKGCGTMTKGKLANGAVAHICQSCSTVMPLPIDGQRYGKE